MSKYSFDPEMRVICMERPCPTGQLGFRTVFGEGWGAQLLQIFSGPVSTAQQWLPNVRPSLLVQNGPGWVQECCPPSWSKSGGIFMCQWLSLSHLESCASLPSHYPLCFFFFFLNMHVPLISPKSSWVTSGSHQQLSMSLCASLYRFPEGLLSEGTVYSSLL